MYFCMTKIKSDYETLENSKAENFFVRSYDSPTIEILTLLTNLMLRLQTCVVIGLKISRSSEFLLHRRSGRLTYENKFDLTYFQV